MRIHNKKRKKDQIFRFGELKKLPNWNLHFPLPSIFRHHHFPTKANAAAATTFPPDTTDQQESKDDNLK